MSVEIQKKNEFQEQSHNEKVAVLIPVYRGSTLIRDALSTLKNQTYKNLKVYISDDTPEHERDEIIATKQIIDEFNEFDISYKANPKNFGYPLNLISLVDWASEDLLFLLAQDDVLSEIAIESCVRAMNEFPEIGAVARPYYWYFDKLTCPVRRIKEMEGSKPLLITAESDIKDIIHVLISASQLTGLMYRKSKLNVEFRDTIFPAHIYPLAGALRDHGVVFLPFNTVAVSIQNSQTRNLSSIYEESPTTAWIEMYQEVFQDGQNDRIALAGIRDHMGKNYIGFVQIRCYGNYKQFLREIRLVVSARPMNIASPLFWTSVVLLAVSPRTVSRVLVDRFKTNVLSKKLKHVALATSVDKWW